MQQTYIEKVYQGLRHAIAQGQYELTDFLVESEIAKQYEVSKGTAAEALHQLCTEDVLVSFPRKGYMIKAVSDEEHHEIQRLRFAVESLVIRILIVSGSDGELESLYDILDHPDREKADMAFSDNTYFHLSLAELTGDRTIRKTLSSLLDALSRTRAYFAVVKLPAGMTDMHRPLVDAIVARDYEQAVSCLKSDLMLADDTVTADMQINFQGEKK